jgi:hypothetical protein
MAQRRKRSSDYVNPRHWTVRLKRKLKVTWLALCLGALAVWWLDWGFTDGAGQRIEHRQLLDAAMGVLAFPAGLLWVWLAPHFEPIARAAARAAGMPLPVWRDYGPALLTWSGATLAGYIQWFWLLPRVFALRSRN